MRPVNAHAGIPEAGLHPLDWPEYEEYRAEVGVVAVVAENLQKCRVDIVGLKCSNVTRFTLAVTYAACQAGSCVGAQAGIIMEMIGQSFEGAQAPSRGKRCLVLLTPKGFPMPKRTMR